MRVGEFFCFFVPSHGQSGLTEHAFGMTTDDG